MMTTPPHITVLGSLNMDLVSYVPHHPAPGETLKSNSFSMAPGGKGANQAAACAKLSRGRPGAGARPPPSADIRMVGAVGADDYGQQLLDGLAEVGVDVSWIRRMGDATTGVAVILVDEPTGENRIVYTPGANFALEPEHVGSPDMFLVLSDGGGGDGGLAPTDLVVMQLESPLATVVAATHTAHAAGIPVLLNAAPAPSAADVAMFAAAVFPMLAHLVVNETEAAALGGVDVAALDDVAGLDGVARSFIARGVKAVVITLGARGAFWAAGAATGFVPAVAVEHVVDTTAAGDTFVGVYALRVASGRCSIEDAVYHAVAAAALTVQRKGAQSSIPWGDE
jgi:ribokinase